MYNQQDGIIILLSEDWEYASTYSILTSTSKDTKGNLPTNMIIQHSI